MKLLYTLTTYPPTISGAAIMIAPINQDQLSQKGLARAKQFSWQKCAEQNVEIYHHIL